MTVRVASWAAAAAVGGTAMPSSGDRLSGSAMWLYSRVRLAEARVAVAVAVAVAVDRREAGLEAAFTPEQRGAIRDWLEGISEACR
ncbi:hypothetical protein ACIBBE_37485 [Streptomyces sp. NPDC051644]|uniref:hypothetical protein n=1 Tax=Streptomyces sp. NPDC051644 TaxID=3365666 RepID=UPI0037A4B5C1